MKKTIEQIYQHDNTVSVGRIQYINVNPIYYNFTKYLFPLNTVIVSRPPAVLNQLMADNNLDISSVSSSAYIENSDKWLILPDLSISCYGKVMSVLLASQYPFQELNGRKILLTDESATASNLLKLIFAQNGVQPIYQIEKIQSPSELKNSADAGLIIGDTALKQDWQHHFKHVWDLCEIWNQMTGLPFVFGIWVARRSFADERPEAMAMILEAFYRSKVDGLSHISNIAVTAARKLGLPTDVCKAYYNCMTYNLGDPEHQALTIFFKGLYDHAIINKDPKLNFYQNTLETVKNKRKILAC
jgi:chorismate dehydratase